MAVSASGASSAPFASFVKYVPVGIKRTEKKKKKERLGGFSFTLHYRKYISNNAPIAS